MITPEILEYIRQQKIAGSSEQDIKDALRAKGWIDEDIDDAWQKAGTAAEVPTPIQNKTMLISPTGLLRQSWDGYQKNISRWVQIAAVTAGVSLLMYWVNTINGNLNDTIAYLDRPQVMNAMQRVILGIAVILFAVIAQSWAQLALIFAVKDDTLSVQDAFRLAWGKILSFWWINILLGLVFLGGIILLIIPAVIFAIWFSFAPYVMVDQEKRGVAALSESKRLVKGRWGSVFVRLLVMGAVVLAGYLVVSIVAGIIAGLIAVPIFVQIVNAALNLVVGPFAVAYCSLLYKNLLRTAKA